MTKTGIGKLFVPNKNSHKGENGRLLIIGGSKKYHGAPALSILAARRFVDLVYFYPGEKDENLIREVKKIPEVIVLRKLNEIDLEKIDCVLFGIGLGNAKIDITKLMTQDPKLKIMNPKLKTGNWKLVIDGDGLKRVKGKIPKGAILTPHEGEFKMLFSIPGTKENVKAMAKKHKCIILKKGQMDIISDGTKLKTNKTHNAGMTKGGTGDVLSGLVAALVCKNDSFKAAYAGALINGLAGELLRKEVGFNFCASDLANRLNKAYRLVVNTGTTNSSRL
ncbi:NAD(P)H-hydrate dehydratase [Candidatus Micrarchaeota archaeon]|nr:NAD(P)H-hydrate dehydratase [Candidatus Micrarchaeota archaeon]MBU1165922.1 NAD(P)H-hydrate dehydratase [Candidatus Micrarchaeota archaeon]MBU1887150.1 NAD(P)H-hydrate dehydratase [Candidatus Micrarchaeota archaeon]